ncbi:phospholipid carrier-dependent glycosyltransferase [Oscillatoriales cyanobacterium LEGE 11467]|uniref:Phospholipid carrier-dependent glycosyltransferase n=1 Tax=Zarconia navalis LEGE 11467 TaxID=1828826 RepID=A0A928W374_9CYAN|nr:phospholipid carrier-dependent glycosyltransferase [Zarconia navalis]MBE9042425.1 phospholipid carrier-dependent glycosyltransferase [Zarconia navalis LEGE 11467]
MTRLSKLRKSERLATGSDTALLLGIFVISLALRAIAIDVPVNLDEVSWMERGSEFFRQFLEEDYQDTYLRHHPGIVNMWIVGSGMFVNCRLHELMPGLFDLAEGLTVRECMKSEQFSIALFILPRLFQALITAICTCALYALTQRLLGKSIALVATVLLILDPFFLAYQRFVTTDAMQVDLSTLGLLLLLLYLRGNGKTSRRTLRDRLGLLASGVLMGLATAAKIPALFVLPAVFTWIACIELGMWQPVFRPRGWLPQIFDLTLWLAAIPATIYAIWPVLWVAPEATLHRLYQGLLEESQRGFFFFWGQLTDAPNALFYPVVLVYRLSPAIFVGGLIYTLARLRPQLYRWFGKNLPLGKTGFAQINARPELNALILAVAWILVVLSLLDSKIDRYILPTVPFLAMLAATAWLQVWHWLQRKFPRLARTLGIKANLAVSCALFAIVAQLAVLLPHFPYYITYFNPLAGGSRVAQHLLMVGQGEGLDRAARWLNKSPEAERTLVASAYSKALEPYFLGEATNIGRDKPSPERLRRWVGAHRIVLYFNQFQRQIPDGEFLAYFRGQQPLYTLHIDGLDYVNIYPGPTLLPEDLARIQSPVNTTFTPSIRLLGYDLNRDRWTPEKPGKITLYWHFLEDALPNLEVEIALVNVSDEVPHKWQSPLVNGYLGQTDSIALGTLLRDFHQLPLTSDIVPGRYQIQVRLVFPDAIQPANANPTILGEVEIGD